MELKTGHKNRRDQSESSMLREHADMFKALSNPNRLRMINLLAQRGELCVCEVVAALGNGQSLASYHLAVLAKIGLVRCRLQGTWTYYSLDREKIRSILSPECCHSLLKQTEVFVTR